ncbi:farnesoate epoxidase-like [Pectinophora gossypiella]|uniref:farnesoate epoxidase-like n=1 Tax=Pectinophora gossypiella TaxID=13191 RepID=UPI00214EC3C1|nr:farnesoate epoxidase-like [Pectinophora gossypiella]
MRRRRFQSSFPRSYAAIIHPVCPPTLPIIGNLLSAWFKYKELKYYHSVWQAWARQYGDILGLRLGFVDIVVVSGRDMIKEVSSREVFDGRPGGFFYMIRSFGKKLGIVFSDGSSWNMTRRVVIKYLKSFGYGTRSMETNIAQECKALVELRMSDAGQPVLVNDMFDVSIINILWRLVAGKRYDLKDERLKELCHLIKRAFAVVDMTGGILNFMPFLRHLIPGLTGYTEMKEVYDSLYKFLRDIIKEHQESIDVKCPRDVIDTFLIEMMNTKDGAFKITDEELQVVCMDLLQAGVETVGNTAVFMMLHLVRNEDAQARLWKEIDDVIGRDRPPTLNDRTKMVYTEAVLLESLRISSVAAVGIPHMALDDARLGDYVVPKGTFVLLAMYDLHNGSHWKDPQEFRPERFLTKDGNLIQDEWLMPFGMGKRRCIGEGLARSELFMFLTYILQKFHLKIPEGDPLPATEPIEGVSLSAKPFKIVFEPRIKTRYSGRRPSLVTA